tara:strand:+ start:391 stop:1224 length:834 start_codon:yes stop_codon:yes gene_type:complete
MIGIIGQGFVGNAIYQKFKNYFTVLTYDLNKDLCNSTLENVCDRCDTIFVCLPTPMNEDGSCSTDILEDALKDIEILTSFEQKPKTIVLKSTVPPGTTEKWNIEHNFLKFVFNPEFLTEANAVNDFENQKRIILGGPKSETTKLKKIYSKVFPKAHIIKTDSKHAEMVKYLTNCFLATKVSFANEIYQVCEKLKVDYSKVVKYAVLDERLGKSHWNVPGPDGDFGFGGHCLPKDLSAFIHLAMKLDTETNVLNAVEETNDVVRKNRDWEDMKGRAVV